MATSTFRPRIEDAALVTGRGRFVADTVPAGAAAAVFVRSPHAHAAIERVDVAAARAAPGVLAVLTGADMEKAGVANIATVMPMTGRGGAPLVVPARPSLARERVVHVGEPVALVVAESRALAEDAAELVEVAYRPLDPVLDVRAATGPGAPQLWPDAPGNLAIDWPGVVPDEANAREVDAIIAGAPHVARVSVANQRLVVASMEPRGATGAFDPATGDYTLTACTQGAGALRDPLAKVLGADPQRVRVVTEDVGGAFGMKTPVYPEYPALLVAAKAVGRPVHWMSTRGEAFLTDNQARDTLTEAALALDKDGRFLALRVRALADMGAYLSTVSAFIASSNFARCFPAVYDIPRIAVEVRCVFTNTVPTGPYRGAGRPEANYAMERVVEEAARLTGIDRVELRRHNLIRPETMPYRSAVGIVYDTGEFERVLDRALELSRYGEFPARRARSEDAGKRRGIGISCFVEHAGGQPREGAGLAFPADGRAELSIAAGASGQGHGTVFGRILAQRLGIPEKQIRVRQGDSRHGIEGAGSIASRSTMVTGAALVRVVDLVVEKGKAVAARMLEASELDIAYRGGAFEVPGTDRRVSLFDVAAEARASGAPLDEKTVTETPQTFPNGCHIAEVEVDPETGHVQVVGYAAVDDCGTPLDPVLIEGQLQGGVAQGLGQVVMENAIYDKATGQLLTASFMDYAMPRADDVPDVRGALHPLAATTNPLGVKGVGEAGTVGALAAITNAVADALPGAAAARLDMPATPERVWRAFNPG